MSERCSERVRGKGRWPSYSQCRRPASVERGGKPYCGTHDPVRVAEKRAARDAEREAEHRSKRVALYRCGVCGTERRSKSGLARLGKCRVCGVAFMERVSEEVRDGR